MEKQHVAVTTNQMGKTHPGPTKIRRLKVKANQCGSTSVGY